MTSYVWCLCEEGWKAGLSRATCPSVGSPWNFSQGDPLLSLPLGRWLSAARTKERPGILSLVKAVLAISESKGGEADVTSLWDEGQRVVMAQNKIHSN